MRPLQGSHDPHLLQLASQVTRNTDPNPPSPIFLALPIWLGKQELNIEGETNLRTRIEAPIEKFEISVKKGIALRRSVSEIFSRNSLTLNKMFICFSCFQFTNSLPRGGRLALGQLRRLTGSSLGACLSADTRRLPEPSAEGSDVEQLLMSRKFPLPTMQC